MPMNRRFPNALAAAGSLAILLTIAGAARGQQSTNSPDEPHPAIIQEPGTTAAPPDAEYESFDLRTTKRLTGEWGGLRTDLEDAGISFKIKLMNQFQVNMRGGNETTNGHDTAGSFELDLFLDLEKMNLVDGATFYIRGKSTWGGDDSDFDKEKVGGFFKTNQDASSEEAAFVDKWWWAQFLADKKIEFRLGRIEPSKDLFDTSKVMGDEDSQFLNQALVRSAVIPSNKGLGAYINFDVTDAFYVRAAAIDAHSRDRQTNFDTAFHEEDEFRFYGEVGYKSAFESAKGKLDGRYRLGTTYDPTEKTQFFDTLGGARATRHQSGDWTGYFGFDQMVWKENDNPKDKQGISVAGRYGRSNGEVNRIEHFWAVAAQYEGLVPARDKDVLGLGVAQGIFADELRRVSPNADRETVYELYYAIYVAPWLIISPDLQMITNPGGQQDDRDAFVAGMRMKMSL